MQLTPLTGTMTRPLPGPPVQPADATHSPHGDDDFRDPFYTCALLYMMQLTPLTGTMTTSFSPAKLYCVLMQLTPLTGTMTG